MLNLIVDPTWIVFVQSPTFGFLGMLWRMRLQCNFKGLWMKWITLDPFHSEFRPGYGTDSVLIAFLDDVVGAGWG